MLDSRIRKDNRIYEDTVIELPVEFEGFLEPMTAKFQTAKNKQTKILKYSYHELKQKKAHVEYA